MIVQNAIGGENVTTTIEGRERYPVNVRYMRDYRSDPARLGRALVSTMDGRMQIPLAEIADLRFASGPAMLRNENGMLTGYVYIDVAGRDLGSYVAGSAPRGARERAVARRLHDCAGAASTKRWSACASASKSSSRSPCCSSSSCCA